MHFAQTMTNTLTLGDCSDFDTNLMIAESMALRTQKQKDYSQMHEAHEM